MMDLENVLNLIGKACEKIEELFKLKYQYKAHTPELLHYFKTDVITLTEIYNSQLRNQLGIELIFDISMDKEDDTNIIIIPRLRNIHYINANKEDMD